MIGTRIGTRVRSRALGAWRPGGVGPVDPTVPVDLPAAVVARFRARPELAAAARIYQATAGSESPPYVVFTVRRSPTTRTTSDSLWREAALAFEAVAGTVEAAEALAALVSAAFKGATLEWRGGYAIPLVPADAGQAAVQARAKGAGRAFVARTAFVARCREPR